MADLIIKPNSATGDKLILQDRAGGAVLTTADSGATMASTVTGIPAAGVTGVLPSAVTGGSGLTALGTVTAGNLSNTAIVYPAGHVIQTTAVINGTTVSSVNLPTNNAWRSTVVAGTITPLYDNSSIVVHASFTNRVYNTPGDYGFTFRFWKSATGITDSYPTGMSHYGTGTNTHGTVYRNTFQYLDTTDNYDLNLMDADCETTNEITYTLYVSDWGLADTGGNHTIGATYNGSWAIFFQEIKR